MCNSILPLWEKPGTHFSSCALQQPGCRQRMGHEKLSHSLTNQSIAHTHAHTHTHTLSWCLRKIQQNAVLKKQFFFHSFLTSCCSTVSDRLHLIIQSSVPAVFKTVSISVWLQAHFLPAPVGQPLLQRLFLCSSWRLRSRERFIRASNRSWTQHSRTFVWTLWPLLILFLSHFWTLPGKVFKF